MSDGLLGLRVLVVDASDDRRHVLSRRLQGDGASVLAAACGVDAVKLASTNCFDIALVDLALPGGCNEELIKLLAGVACRGVLAISTTPQQDQARAIDAGAARVFARPVDWNDLLQHLQWTLPGVPTTGARSPRPAE